jgi:AcrR family transcriptional regulator
MVDQRRAHTRRRLLEAGHRLIARDGAAALRIADITSEAGVALGSFQNHFTSKDSFVEAVARVAIEALAAEIVEAPGRDEPPMDQAIAALRRFVRLAYDDPSFCTLIINLAHGEELFVDAIRPFAQGVLQRAVDEGGFAIDDIDVAVTFIVTGALGVIRRCLSHPAEADADVQLARIVLQGICVDKSEASRILAIPMRPSTITSQMSSRRNALEPTPRNGN